MAEAGGGGGAGHIKCLNIVYSIFMHTYFFSHAVVVVGILRILRRFVRVYQKLLISTVSTVSLSEALHHREIREGPGPTSLTKQETETNRERETERGSQRDFFPYPNVIPGPVCACYFSKNLFIVAAAAPSCSFSSSFFLLLLIPLFPTASAPVSASTSVCCLSLSLARLLSLNLFGKIFAVLAF